MNNPSAFPLTESTHVDGEHYAHPGMTLRDYFAAHVAAQMMSMCQSREGYWSDVNVAHSAYKLADAMLKAREVVSDE